MRGEKDEVEERGEVGKIFTAEARRRGEKRSGDPVIAVIW
jgi:hypothetical protein